jgi:hypothetical protein
MKDSNPENLLNGGCALKSPIDLDWILTVAEIFEIDLLKKC